MRPNDSRPKTQRPPDRSKGGLRSRHGQGRRHTALPLPLLPLGPGGVRSATVAANLARDASRLVRGDQRCQEGVEPGRQPSVSRVAERRGFEPRVPFWGTPAFQASTLSQLGHLSIDLVLWHVALAESEGFEPPVPRGTPDFESGTFNHSDSSPGRPLDPWYATRSTTPPRRWKPRESTGLSVENASHTPP